MNVQLKEIANIQFGHYAQPSKEGDIPYFLAKHFNQYGQYVGQNDCFLKDEGNLETKLLRHNYILFVGKGFRHFAAMYKEEFGQAIASSIFFIIKVNETKILPEYLVSVLNLPKSTNYFQYSSKGSSIPSISKSELADFSFNLIPIEKQKQIVKITNLYLEDLRITEEIQKNKQKKYFSILSSFIE